MHVRAYFIDSMKWLKISRRKTKIGDKDWLDIRARNEITNIANNDASKKTKSGYILRPLSSPPGDGW